MGWFKNAVRRVGDFIGDLFTPSYDNSNESPVIDNGSLQYRINQETANTINKLNAANGIDSRISGSDVAAAAAAYGITMPVVSTSTSKDTGAGADQETVVAYSTPTTTTTPSTTTPTTTTPEVFTYSFLGGEEKTYPFIEIIRSANNAYATGKAGLDRATFHGLEFYANSKNPIYSSLAQDALDFWGGSHDKIMENYYLHNPKSEKDTPPIYINYSSSGAQSAYDARLKAIEEQRAYAEKLAEQARQEAIKNAYVNYDRSLSTYGQNAERLAQMGLSNSGYGDYLNGVAYSSMVGGVQDAHKTANEAVERAYYNASQQKAEAADTLYERQVAERAEKAQLLASIYSAVQSGNLSAEAAEDILSAYGIGEAGSNSKTPTTTTTTTGSNILNNIGANKDEYTYNNAKENISADMSDEYIELLGYNETVTSRLKEFRNDLLEIQLVETYKNSESAETDTIKAVENAKTKISADIYQECYFYNALNLIDCVVNGKVTAEKVRESLVRWNKGGQLNNEDYTNLSNYLDNMTKVATSAEKVKSKAGFGNIMASIFSSLSMNPFVGRFIWDNRRNVYINDKKYTVDVIDSYAPSKEERDLFDNVAGGGNVIRVGDEYYVKHSRTGEWAKVKKKGTDDAFFETVNSMLETPIIIDRPTHKKIQ